MSRLRASPGMAMLEGQPPDVASLHSSYTYSIPPPAVRRGRVQTIPHERRRGMLNVRQAQSSWRASLATLATATLIFMSAPPAAQTARPSELPLSQADTACQRILTLRPAA